MCALFLCDQWHLCEFKVLKVHSVLIARKQKPDTCKFGLRRPSIQLPLLKTREKITSSNGK